MSNTPEIKRQATEPTKEQKEPGFLGRLFRKLDDSMKRKAKAGKGSCCGGSSDGKGGKPCC